MVVSIFNHAIFPAFNVVSLFVCLLAAILVLCLKLYKKFVYRIALYQVLSAMAAAFVQILQVLFINYEKSPNYRDFCTAIGFLVLYTIWVKLLFSFWVTFHLFCFAVLHKNCTQCEWIHVVTSLLVPMAIAIVPLITKSYGISPDGNICYVYANTTDAYIERLALWDGPAIVLLITTSVAMVVLVIKLIMQYNWRSKYEPITDGDQFWNTLKQLLPLAAFPILFFIFEIPVFLYHIYTTQHSTPNKGMFYANVVSFSLMSFFSGLLLLVNICLVQKHACNLKKRTPANVRTNTYKSCARPTGSAPSPAQ